MVGIGPRPSDFHESEVEQVFLLTRRRSSFRRHRRLRRAWLRAASEPREPAQSVIRRSLRGRNETTWIDDGWDDDLASDDDLADVGASRFARRRRWMRVLGVFAVLGALAGGTFVLQKPKVRHEALSFVTMGHEDAAVRLGRRMASIVESWRHR
jgi:hypothetical protein